MKISLVFEKSNILLIYGLVFISIFVDNARTENVYQIVLPSAPSTFDPAKTTDTSSSTIILQIFDTLFIRDERGDVVPSLIEKFTLSQDRKCYQFTLKDNIYFHNNKPITSYDVEYSIIRKLSSSSIDDKGFDIVRGADLARKKKVAHIKGITVISNRNFEICLKHPFPQFIEMLADITFSINFRTFKKSAEHNVIIGSGSYRVDLIKDDTIILKKFKKYWNQTFDIDKIVYRVARNFTEAQKLLISNNLDNTFPFPSLIPPTNEWQQYRYFHGSVRYLGFNVARKNLDSIEIRKALVSVLPIEEYHRKLNNIKYPIAYFVPIGLPGYIEESWKTPLPQIKAEKILKSLQWDKPLKVVNYLPENEFNDIGNEICTIWKKNNIPCSFESILLKEFIQRIENKQLEVFIGKLMPHIPDTYQLLSFFRSHALSSNFNLEDPLIDQLLDNSLKSEKAEVRTEYFRKINKRIGEQLYAIPLKYQGQQTFYIRKKFILPSINASGPDFLRINTIKVAEE